MMALGHRAGRRGGHDAPTRSSPRPAASRASARRPVLRGHRPGHLQHRPGGGRRGHHAADEGDHPGAPVRRRARTWTRSWTAARAGGRAGHRGRGAGHRRQLPRAGRSAGSARSGASRSSRARTSARSATAGLVTTNDAALAQRVRLHAQPRGRAEVPTTSVVGGNFRLDALQAAVLRVKAPHLPALDARRAGATPRATARCSRDAGLAGRVGLPGGAARPDYHIYNQFVDARARAATRVKARARGARASARRSTIRCRSTCRSASRTSATGRATSRTPSGPPPRRSRCPIYGELTETQQASSSSRIASAPRDAASDRQTPRR